MLETQKFEPSQLPPVIPADKSDDTITFTAEEWAYFIDEVNKQVAEGTLNFDKATNNARYLAMLDKGFADMKAGRGTVMTFDELEAYL